MPTLRQGAIRWLVPVLVGLLCLGLLAPPLSLAASDLEIGSNATIAAANGDDVRLRAAPGYDAEVLAMLPEGTTVAVLDGPITADDGSVWYQAKTTAGTGYIVADFLAGATSETGTTTAADVNATEVTTAAVGSDGQTATTTTALNLRSGPSTTNAVLLVMPAGSTVTITGNAQNGFYPVTYKGTGGWASTNFLTLGGSGTLPPASGTTTVTSALNLRSGPSTSDPVISVMPAGATVTLTGESAIGFLGVTYNGRTGWAYATFLSTSGATPPPTPEPSPGTGTATVTNSLNLRAGPSTADAVIAVMPAGSTVTLTGNSSNGFLSVSFNGREGWAYATYLDTDGGTDPPPTTPPSSGTGTAVATAAVNLRAGPSTSDAVIAVIPSGGTVTVTGSAQNGFYPVTYAGRSGWAYGAYLSIGGSGTTPPPGGGGSGIVWPLASGAAWNIIQGYNGGTHQNRDALAQYYYAFDLARVDGNTAGQSVLSPVSGTIRWTHAPSGGIAINMGNGYAVAMFHATFLSSLTAGQTVSQGQYLGTISGPGGNGYAVVPHLEMDVWRTSDGGLSRSSVPFTGINAISGTAFPDIGGYNQYYGTVFYP